MADDECRTRPYSHRLAYSFGDEVRGVGIEGRGRFVEQQKRLAKGNGSGEQNALALAAREFGCLKVEYFGIEAKGREDGFDTTADIAVGAQVVCQGYEVASGGGNRLQFLWQIGSMLTQHVDVAVVEPDAADIDLSGREGHEAEDGTQQ